MKWLRRFGWAVLGLLVLWALAWLAVPPLLKSQVQQRLGSALGRTVTLGDVSFSPWSLELTVRDIVVGGVPVGAAGAPAASVPLLKVARFYVNADISSLLRLAPVIEAFEVDAPELKVTRTSDGRYDIDDLIARFAPTDPEPPASEPVLFALYNLKLRDAVVVFDDRPVGKEHRLTAMNLSLPFLANLPAHIDVQVQPRLAFQLNGTPFDTGAQTTPFAQSRAAALQFKMGDLDLKPYLGYLPDALPFRLRDGRASADLELDFQVVDGALPSIVLRGTVGLQNVEADDVAGAPLLAWKRLDVALRDIQPLKRELSFGAIELDAPTLHVTRDAAGRLNLAQLSAPAPVVAPAAAAVAASPASAAAAAPASPWRVQVDALHVGGWRVLWADANLTPAAALALEAIDLKAGPLSYPFATDAAMPLNLQATLTAPAAGSTSQGRLSVEGRVSDRQAVLDLRLTDLTLDALAPYLAESLRPQISGMLAASAQLIWAAGDPARLQIARGEFVLDGLRVTETAAVSSPGKAAVAPAAVALKQLSVQGADVDLQARELSLASVKLVQPAVAVSRDRAGLLNVQRWMKPGPAAADSTVAASTVAPAASAAASADDVPWRVALRDLSVDGGSLRFDDAYVAGHADTEPLRLEVAALKLGVQNLALAGSRTTAPAQVQLSARLAGPRDLDHAPDKSAAKAVAGLIDWRGRLGLQPLAIQGSVKLDRFPLQAFEPYVRDRLPVSLLRAEAGLKAEVAVKELPAGLDIGVVGDLLLADVLVHSRPAADAPAGLGSTDELLSWQSFKLSGVTLALAPARPPKIDITEAVLADFYTRLVITEQGRFNLQDVGPAAAAASSAESGTAPARAPVPPSAVVVNAAAAQASAPAADAPASALELSVGATKLINGRVDFTDRFVRPNYSADLTQLNGSLGAFRSGSREMATLELRGRAAGTALLDISGQLNPTAEPLALNIRAKATDLELAPLSPYAAKYAGYAIERGKLSMDVSYVITPDGKLEAKNQVILNQLTFGERIDSPSATQLPVLLAVALLKDRHGVIDINLPVSGSLNDPQFSVGGIIFKVIINLITKALTAPFSLLFGGGGEDLSEVAFRLGVPAVTESGAAALDKVAQALIDRPSLKMTVTGASDPAGEREAYIQAALDARLLQEKKKEQARAGAPAVAASAAAGAVTETVSGAERERLLKAVYRQTDLPDKPRNLIGLAKDIPATEMEALLKARIVVTDEAMRELALQRGLAVRDALIAKGLPSERLFIASPKLRPPGDQAEAWIPSAKLSLANN